MQSRNPVFTRGDGFRSSGGGYGSGQTMTAEQLQGMYEAPSYQPPAPGRMTLDDVVARTAITLGTLAIVAALTWVFVTPTFPLVIGAALVGLGFGFFLALKHVTNPALILTYAVVQGVFIGMASKVIAGYAAGYLGGGTGLVAQAVMATLATAGVMLALYKFEVIRVTPKFVKFLTAAIAGFFLVIMLNLVLTLFGAGFGASGFGTMGLIFAVIGAGLAAFSLLLDFEFIKQSIQHGAPEKEAWFAAFGLTVTLVWLYLEILRILAILQSSD